MITLATRLKVIAFAVAGSLAVAFVGLHYADLGRLVGMSGYYTVKVDLAQTGGLTTNADVTYLGTSVGRVGPVRLTGDGVVAELHIDDGAPRIPAGTRAVVANRSAVGEQYLDLRPARGGGPYLAAGATIPRAATSTPAPVTDLLTSVDALAASVPLDALRTVVDEFGTAFAGQGPNLQALLDSGRAFTATADRHIVPTTTLIHDGGAVLRTQNDEAAALASFGRNARLLAAQLRASDGDLRRVIAAGPGASAEVAGLLRDLDPDFSVLLANLTSVSDVFATRSRALEELLANVPAAVSAATSMVKDGRLQFGMVTTFFDPPPCVSGYGGTPYRNGTDTSAGAPFNTAARCTAPASSGVNVRGAANAPKGGPLPAPAKPGSVAATGAGALPGALGLPGLPPAAADLLGLTGAGR
ncbi:MCE family protein [Actinomadura parmotrematis]|uniref:MCE family protein n=1 Tax=Actinomadura parmotrematis TaxID=2864039 RepID=A0ABS7FMQ9_9ACTN|nr:MlaD family protein [Actinomadura parmotrematis]MBW8481664.1 MCE family protein [Actinomadura parmotrematis]